MERVVLMKVEPPKVLAFFENFREATQTRRFLDERKGEGLYICLRESEAYTQFPRLATLKH
tara:strand:- start:585 stop:767 length:183 start_codon:yes stop_codon:yes gene_type:complete